ncbi:hypothetical protein [Pseudoflavonifractor sp. 60]|uniref:hypothetical protein n=1 Tax=Pseudoflavonifractor sp. 60 TaxID=2304576 RepID=UPI001368C9CF|nr:hypothetical protein [Pseudoflavonifractor sp. 60]
MIDVREGELVELAALADSKELGEDRGDLALDLPVAGDVVGGDNNLDILGNDDGGFHKDVVVWSGDLVNLFSNRIKQSFGGLSHRARDNDFVNMS